MCRLRRASSPRSHEAKSPRKRLGKIRRLKRVFISELRKRVKSIPGGWRIACPKAKECT